MENEKPVILALYPNVRGLGYACLQLPQNLHDYGVVSGNAASNGKLLRRVERFMDYYQPKVILVRDLDSLDRGKAGRQKKLIEAILTLSGEKDIPVSHYSRDQIKDVFQQFGASTKFQMAQKISSWFPDLELRTPKLPKIYLPEDYNMGIFDALSLAIAHAYLSE